MFRIFKPFFKAKKPIKINDHEKTQKFIERCIYIVTPPILFYSYFYFEKHPMPPSPDMEDQMKTGGKCQDVTWAYTPFGQPIRIHNYPFYTAEERKRFEEEMQRKYQKEQEAEEIKKAWKAISKPGSKQ